MGSRMLWCVGVWAIWSWTNPVFAQTPTCSSLDGDQKRLAQELMNSQHPYDCCDQTIANCLEQKPTCVLAVRLAENICRQVKQKQDRQKITRALTQRARSMMGLGPPAKIDLTGVPVVGAANARVNLVVYACARCPYCSRITPLLHEAIVRGRLKDKARLYFKSFPIRSHPFSKETGLAFVAAARLDQFWAFALHVYAHFDDFCEKKLVKWAAEVGMDPADFEKLYQDPQTRTSLVNYKKEGIVNKVEATPAFFINNRRYSGDLSIEELVDVVEEEFDRVTGKIYIE